MIDVISRTYWPATRGGAEKYIYELISRIKKYTFNVYTWDKVRGTVQISIPKIKYIGSFIFSLKASKKINKSNSKLVHINQYWTEYSSFFLKKDFIVSIHDFPNDFRKKIVLYAAKKSKKVLANSNHTLQDLISKGIPEEKCVLVLPGIDDKFRKIRKKKHRLLNFLFLGRIALNKDIITILKALSRLKQDFRFYIVGQKLEWTNYHNKVVSEIKKLGLEQKVVLTGVLDDKELVDLLSKIDIYIHASKYGEGFGSPIVEAQAARIPVIVSDLFYELGTVNKNNALIFKRGDPIDLLKKIKELLSSSKLKRSLILNGLKNIKIYDWKNSAKILRKVYDEFL